MANEEAKSTVTETIDDLNENPSELKTWGVTAATATVGALTVPTIANVALGVLGVAGAVVTIPTVAVAAGAVGGGMLGWNYMKGK